MMIDSVYTCGIYYSLKIYYWYMYRYAYLYSCSLVSSGSALVSNRVTRFCLWSVSGRSLVGLYSESEEV